MQDSSSKRRSRVRQIALTACALAALISSGFATASPAAPTISGTPPTTGSTGQAYSFTPTATGPSGYTLRFTILDTPSWATFNSATGHLSGTPTVPGTYSNIVIGVTDGLARATLASFNISVSRSSGGTSGGGSSGGLSISGSPPTSATVAKTYSFKPSATGPSGQTLRFSILDMPSWGSFNSATGQLSGTPTVPGNYSNIVISVSDASRRVSLSPFTISVAKSSGISAPTIAGSPSTSATVSKAYSFTPTATVPSGDSESFSVQNKPSWASFSIATGALSGTPTAANVGTTSNIVISVSDGTSSAALAPFSLTVSQGSTSTGSAKLSWTAPTTNTNGSALTNLAGYHISYGNSPSSMTTTVTVASPGTTSYTVSNLTSGTWYFAVNAYTTSGTQSANSNVGSKSVP